jgi:hypothetical protein
MVSKDSGRATAQAVSHWLPTAGIRVRARVWSCGICDDKVAMQQVSSEYFGLPTAQQSPSPIIWGWYNRPIVAAVPSGPDLTPL